MKIIHANDLDPYLLVRGLPIRDALLRLNAAPNPFLLVVDQNRVLLGTVTDGDVRRALLRGVSLDNAVDQCMRGDFISGRAGSDRASHDLMMHGERWITFLPVLDEKGVIAEVIVRDFGGPDIAHALVMAGGFGKRLGERTRETPKPLLPVGGRPILDRILSTLEESRVRNVYISVHYLADQIRQFVKDRPNRAAVNLIEEDEPLGTAGALGRLRVTDRSPLLVMNGDVITNVDFTALHEFHVRHGLDATIGVARYDVDIPFGVVRYGEGGAFVGIEEKPRISNFIAAGLYYLSPEFVALVPSNRPMDMPELLNLGKTIGLKIGLFPIHEYWTDIGRADDLESAQHRYRTNPH